MQRNYFRVKSLAGKLLKKLIKGNALSKSLSFISQFRDLEASAERKAKKKWRLPEWMSNCFIILLINPFWIIRREKKRRNKFRALLEGWKTRYHISNHPSSLKNFRPTAFVNQISSLRLRKSLRNAHLLLFKMTLSWRALCLLPVFTINLFSKNKDFQQTTIKEFNNARLQSY